MSSWRMIRVARVVCCVLLCCVYPVRDGRYKPVIHLAALSWSPVRIGSDDPIVDLARDVGRLLFCRGFPVRVDGMEILGFIVHVFSSAVVMEDCDQI